MFQPSPAVLADVRDHVRSLLAGRPRLVERVVQVASELAATAVSEGAEFRVSVSGDGSRVRLQVEGPPGTFEQTLLGPGVGLGLRVIEGFSDDWGVHQGTVVWAEFREGPGEGDGRQRETA